MSGASITAAQATAQAVRKSGHLIAGATALTPFDEMVEREEHDHDDDERKIRDEAVSTWLGWIWEGGLDLPRAVKRLVTYTRLYRPELVHNLTCEEAAALFAQGKAAESARVEVITDTLKKAGYRHTMLPSRKSERSRQKMAKAQVGNKHRARSVKPKPTL